MVMNAPAGSSAADAAQRTGCFRRRSAEADLTTRSDQDDLDEVFPLERIPVENERREAINAKFT
jgi:hypothetical protein